jgi:catalase
MTTNQGGLINDDQNSLKAGVRGPTLLEDFQFREKMTHFDHERVTLALHVLIILDPRKSIYH